MEPMKTIPQNRLGLCGLVLLLLAACVALSLIHI
jgi:hypothetical protein